MMRCSVASAPIKFAGDAAVAKHENAMAYAWKFLDFGRS